MRERYVKTLNQHEDRLSELDGLIQSLRSERAAQDEQFATALNKLHADVTFVEVKNFHRSPGMRYSGSSPQPCRGLAMSQAIADPAELASVRPQFATLLCRAANRARGPAWDSTSRLGDTWRDQEYERFRQEFEQALANHDRLVEISGEFVPFLQRKAERIEEYLAQR